MFSTLLFPWEASGKLQDWFQAPSWPEIQSSHWYYLFFRFSISLLTSHAICHCFKYRVVCVEEISFKAEADLHHFEWYTPVNQDNQCLIFFLFLFSWDLIPCSIPVNQLFLVRKLEFLQGCVQRVYVYMEKWGGVWLFLSPDSGIQKVAVFGSISTDPLVLKGMMLGIPRVLQETESWILAHLISQTRIFPCLRSICHVNASKWQDKCYHS